MDRRVAGVGIALAAAALAAAATAATPPVDPGGPNKPAATASLSTTTAGARPVVLTLKLRYDMTCGQPGAGKAVVTLPAADVVPHRIDGAAVLVNGEPSPAVSISGREVSIAMPPTRPGLSCMSIGPGTLTLTFTRAAGLGNPAKAGTYAILARKNAVAFAASVAVTA